MYIIAIVTKEVSPLLVIELSHRFFDIFIEYFGTLDENTIKVFIFFYNF